MGRHFMLVLLRALVSTALVATTAAAQEYVLLGWNDLGMHCSNKNFSKIAVLPPYNTVTAQLVMKSPGQPPQIVTDGYTIEYSIPNNTFSVGKTDFWTYAQQLFGLPAPLPPDVGLTGKGLTGVLDSSGNHFGALGIPVTPFSDTDLVHEAPFQLIHMVARKNADGSVVATTDAVIPVSNEVGCVQSGCHSSEDQILNEHDDVSGFNRNGPVLCASCHASNALGTVGIPEARPFSYRMHNTHRGIAGAANAISTCYKCHPGPNTQCLRDIMGKNPTNPLVCQNCHGSLDTVAATIAAGRRPWLDEPQCGKCHGANYAEQPGKLYRMSTGHGGMYCSACHGSPHAIQPTVQANDNLQNIRLQGYAGALRKCSVCHTTTPNGPGPHGLLDTTIVQVAPPPPPLTAPPNGIAGVSTLPTVQWQANPNALHYILQLATDSGFASLVAVDSAVGQASRSLPSLNSGVTYFWRVQAVNGAGSSPWSETWSFTTASGTTTSYQISGAWNMLSLPMTVANPSVAALLPGAISPAFAFQAGGGYVAGDTLVPGQGYWMRMSGSGIFSVTGQPILVDTITVSDGWNLIGSVADTVTASTIATLPAGIITSRLFGYSTGYQIADVLLPSKAYWVKVAGGGQIVLARVPGAGVPQQAQIAADGVSGAAITFEDAIGQRQTLYVLPSYEQGASARYELPPLPPDGMFDIRFASGRYAEWPPATEGKEAGIRLSGVVYPLLVRWSNGSVSDPDVLSVGGKRIALAGHGSVELESAMGGVTLEFSRKAGLASHYSLSQNSPNPFNPSTVISYTLPDRGHVMLTIYSLLGQQVATLVNGEQGAGEHAIAWNAGTLPSGIYFYRISAGAFSETRKMLLLR